MTLLNLYVDPAGFFRSEVGPGKQSLRGPAWIVVGVCVLSLLHLLLTQHSLFTLIAQSVSENSHLSNAVKSGILGELHGIKPLVLVAGGFGSLFIFLLWPLAPALLANVAILWDRDLQFREMLRCTGLAFLAFYPCQVVSTALLLWPIHLAYNPLLASRDASDLSVDMADLASMVRNGFPFLAVRELNWLALGWFGLVLVIGFRELYRLKWYAAILSVGGIVALFVVGNYIVGMFIGG